MGGQHQQKKMGGPRKEAEGNIRKWEAEGIAHTRAASSSSKARRKNQANTDAAGSPLEAPFQTATVTRRKVAGIDVPS